MASTGNSRSIEAIFESNSDEINALYQLHIPTYLANLQSAVANGDTASIAYQSHRMNSAMKTIGFTDAVSVLEAIEHELPVGETLDQAMTELESMVTNSLDILARRQ